MHVLTFLADGWVYSRTRPRSDVSPLLALACALHTASVELHAAGAGARHFLNVADPFEVRCEAVAPFCAARPQAGQETSTRSLCPMPPPQWGCAAGRRSDCKRLFNIRFRASHWETNVMAA
jgi:hypothetical protein